MKISINTAMLSGRMRWPKGNRKIGIGTIWTGTGRNTRDPSIMSKAGQEVMTGKEAFMGAKTPIRAWTNGLSVAMVGRRPTADEGATTLNGRPQRGELGDDNGRPQVMTAARSFQGSTGRADLRGTWPAGMAAHGSRMAEMAGASRADTPMTPLGMRPNHAAVILKTGVLHELPGSLGHEQRGAEVFDTILC